NTTFYSIPDQATLERWRADVPASFRFCLKLPRSLSHSGSLIANIAAAQQFATQMSTLGSTLGPMFLQLPPNYSPRQQPDLEEFLAAWPHAQVRLAVEVRQAHWFKPGPNTNLNQRLQRWQAGRVLLDTRPIYRCDDDPQVLSERRKPDVPLLPTATTDFALVRFISHPILERNEPYLDEWVTQVQTWLTAGITVYFFVHCPEEVHSPAIAHRFYEKLNAAGVPVGALPWDHVPPEPVEPAQLSLFG
ncbi:MAG: DUF72 domain-containing protein, partial [Cyanobacteria bacterium P01_H01_bin.121]